MDYKKSKAPVNTVTRNIMDLCEDTGNIYESVAIIAKRANQISAQIKDDLSKKLAEFASYNDSLEEMAEAAREDALAKGVLERADSNAQMLIITAARTTLTGIPTSNTNPQILNTINNCDTILKRRPGTSIDNNT